MGSQTVPEGDVAPAAPRKAGAFRKTTDWFFGTSKIATAKTRLVGTTEEQKEYLARARTARELAQRAFDPIDPVRYGKGFDAALELYRRATYWALLSLAQRHDRPNYDDLWNASTAVLATLGLSEDELARARRIANEPDFVHYADLPEAELRDDADLMRRLIDGIFDAVDGPVIALWGLFVRRVLKIVLAVGLLGALGWTAVHFILPERPDLAKGKTWRTSSQLYSCHPEKADCGGVKTRILFHTQEEREPWFEYDLGKPTTFRSMTIRNRNDYGPERAVPLVVEVSNDGKSYKEIARRTKTFSEWKPDFPPQTARYVRLRATRKTFLHLEQIKIHP